MVKMKEVLKQGNYTQIPQLSSGKKMNTNEPFLLKSPGSKRTKALFIGINYPGSKFALSGCVNDALAMKTHVKDVWGFDSGRMKFLADEGNYEKPTRKNIIAAMRWLVDGVKPGKILTTPHSHSSLLFPVLYIVLVPLPFPLTTGIMASGTSFLHCDHENSATNADNGFENCVCVYVCVCVCLRVSLQATRSSSTTLATAPGPRTSTATRRVVLTPPCAPPTTTRRA